jgi:molecular chaperone IbpA
MRSYDLTPFYRSTIGFDRLFSLLDQVSDTAPGYPPYNIERTGENDYRISVAVSGFAENELSIVAKENTLTIKGEKAANENAKDSEVLYRGIAARAFERVFQLADHVQVKNAPRRRSPAAFRSTAAPRCSSSRRSRPKGCASALTTTSKQLRPGHRPGRLYVIRHPEALGEAEPRRATARDSRHLRGPSSFEARPRGRAPQDEGN